MVRKLSMIADSRAQEIGSPMKQLEFSEGPILYAIGQAKSGHLASLNELAE